MQKKLFVYSAFIAITMMSGCTLEPLDAYEGTPCLNLHRLITKIDYGLPNGTHVEVYCNPRSIDSHTDGICDDYITHDFVNDAVSHDAEGQMIFAFNSGLCPESYLCQDNGTCVKSLCNGFDTNLDSDNANCGKCGYKCGNGTTCSNGVCIVADKSKVLCNGEFINPENDPRYCGARGDCKDDNPVSWNYRGIICQGATPVCSNGRCVSACVGGQIVCDGRCVDPQTDMNYCGARGDCIGFNAGEKCANGRFCSGAVCTTSCQAGLFLCDNKCVDGTTNPYYCGVTSDCTESNKGTKCEDTQVCISGKCEYNSCQEPEILCSTIGGNRCINIQSDDADNCGACGYKCTDHPVAFASANGCVAGVCQYQCINNMENVGSDNTAATIRCVNTFTDVNNCGHKGIRCASGQVCVNGSCVQNSCAAPLVLCSTTGGNQCINIQSDDADNCGACGYKCADHPIANATATGCSAGICQYKCINNTENVGSDNTAANIRCVDTSTDINNCGGKGKKCDPGQGQVCVNSSCVQNSCFAPIVLCSTTTGNQCIDIEAHDSNNCGACGYKCADHPVANAVSEKCLYGQCIYECKPGYANKGTGDTASEILCVGSAS